MQPQSNATRKAFFGRLGTENDFRHSIPNAWMAAEPGHPFFLLMLMWTRDKIKAGFADNTMIEDITGPGALFHGLKEFEKAEFHNSSLQEIFAGDSDKGINKLYQARPSLERDDETMVLPFWYIFPYSHSRDGDAFREVCWVNRGGFNATRCKDLIGVDHWPSYSITYWSHTWTEEGHSEHGMSSVQD
jgi:hypothetical protein